MDLFGFDPPDLEEGEVARIARDRYGVTGSQQRLRGERSHNTLFTTDDGRRVVLKVASASDDPATIEFHAGALAHLARVARELPVAEMVPALDGELVPIVERNGGRHAVRMVTFLPGVTFRDDQQITPCGLFGIGRLVGSVSVALADFDHPAADAFMPWDIGNGLVLDDNLWAGLGDDARAVLEPVRERLIAISDDMRSLPRQVIHNDAHAGNLLRRNEQTDEVTGVIDFGDLVRTATAADLGVSGANLVPHQADPIASIAALVAGFHSQRPLREDELAVVPELVLARSALSVLFTDFQIRRAPHIAAAVGAERPHVLENLTRWTALDPNDVRRSINEAIT